jgi:hypothetical protein
VESAPVVTEFVLLHWPDTTEPSTLGGEVPPEPVVVVVVVGAVVVVVVGAVVVVVGGVAGVTSPLSSVVSSSLLVVAMHTSVDAQETLLSWFVVPPASVCHVDPPLPVPASDCVVASPPAQHVKALEQLIELTQPSPPDGRGTVPHVAPESVLVAATAPPPF